MSIDRFDTKDPAEKVTLTFDFTVGLASGELLTGTPTATISMAYGTDSTPSAILNGSAAIDSSSKMVFVPVQAGVDGCEYQIKVVAATTNATKVLALIAVLPVRSMH